MELLCERLPRQRMTKEEQIEQIRRIQESDDPDAWAAIIAQYAGAISRYAKHGPETQEHAARESILLERFMRAVRAFDTTRGVSFSTLLFRTLPRPINSFEFRGAIRLPNSSWHTDPEAYKAATECVDSLDPHDAMQPATTETPAELAERSEMVARVRNAIGDLPDVPRAAVQGVLAGRTQKEMGDERGVTRAAVHEAYKQGLRLLRDALEPPEPSAN